MIIYFTPDHHFSSLYVTSLLLHIASLHFTAHFALPCTFGRFFTTFQQKMWSQILWNVTQGLLVLPTFWDNLSVPFFKVKRSKEHGMDRLSRSVGNTNQPCVTSQKIADFNMATRKQIFFFSSIILISEMHSEV